jgi:nucleotide-binding universal stress UspA family protein
MKTSVGPGSVMVGVDGSAESDAAVVWAATYAAAHRRPLTVVHGTGAPVVTDFGFDLDEARAGLRAAGRRVTEEAVNLARATSPSLDVAVRLEVREPRSLLVDEAAGAEVLVLGSRGHGAILSLLLGSVSVALTALASCPVVVVRSRGDAASGPVVVGIDGTDDSADALTFAFGLASEQHRRLEVVHASGESWLLPPTDFAGPSGELLSADWELLLAESVAGFGEKFPDVVFSTRVVQGSAAGSLVAASERASTLVVGARGRGAVTRRLLGSVSRSVVEHAPCTVAVVRTRT